MESKRCAKSKKMAGGKGIRERRRPYCKSCTRFYILAFDCVSFASRTHFKFLLRGRVIMNSFLYKEI